MALSAVPRPNDRLLHVSADKVRNKKDVSSSHSLILHLGIVKCMLK